MDGNGRWAKERNKPRSFGHMAGVKAIRPIIDECFFNRGIKTVSLFVFSQENWKRDENEISYLFKLLKTFFKTHIEELISKGVRIYVSGDLDDNRIPSGIKKVIDSAINRSKENSSFNFNILFNYGGQQEIVHAVKSIGQNLLNNKLNIDDIDIETVHNSLYTKDLPYVDLLIRTSGEERISNCLLYELSYAEIIFNKVYWPSYSLATLEADLNEFLSRKRRFGGIDE